MRAFVIDPGKSRRYVLREQPIPEPGADEVLLRMTAATLNWRDSFIRQTDDGAYAGNIGGRIPLSDGVGTVVTVGGKVAGLRVNDRVCPCFFPDWLTGPPTPATTSAALGGTADGVLAQYRIVPARSVVRVPSHLSDEEAASLPCAALTAWVGLIERGQLERGETVLLQGTGGVSIFALQFAKAFGARVILMSSSDEKLERARRLGADETINYRENPQWETTVLERTAGLGADHIIEVGGAKTMPHSLASLAMGGHVTLVGVLTGFDSEVPTSFIRKKFARVHGIYVGSRQSFERMNEALTKHQIKPVVDAVFPFLEANEAVDRILTGQHFGKIAIQVADR
jgi:NADPH:quinone reductase-like Zn-dependent oxidoreductase